MVFTSVYEENNEKVFVVRDLIEVHINKNIFERLSKQHETGEIVSYLAPRTLQHHVTGRRLVYVTGESGLPLMGHTAFGLIDRGTNLIQVRPVSGCNLNCVYCSVDEGQSTNTRATDYIVDTEYLLEEARRLAEYKGGGLEMHLDGQGEPFLYPYMTELAHGLKDIQGVEVVSAQTNGMPLSEKLIGELEGAVDRINLSMSSMDPKLARALAGTRDYDLEHVKGVARCIAESSIELLLAPVWVPGWNDSEIDRVIDFGLDVGAGGRWPAFGVQKYVKYKLGRKPKNCKQISFKEFYEILREKEEERGVDLVLNPEMFQNQPMSRVPCPFKRGEVVELPIVEHGRIRGEMLAVDRDRVVQVVNTQAEKGDTITCKVLRTRDNVIVAKEHTGRW